MQGAEAEGSVLQYTTKSEVDSIAARWPLCCTAYNFTGASETLRKRMALTPVFVFSSSSPDNSCFADNFAKINAFREYPLLSIEKVDTFANCINLRPISFERGHRLRGESPI